MCSSLIWTQAPDWNGDGAIDTDGKLTQSASAASVAIINAGSRRGYYDWRLPSIKEIDSVMDFRGPRPASDDTDAPTKFIDITYLYFGYVYLKAAERTIDAQFATTSICVDKVMQGQSAMFGLNLAERFGLNFAPRRSRKRYDIHVAPHSQPCEG